MCDRDPSRAGQRLGDQPLGSPNFSPCTLHHQPQLWTPSGWLHHTYDAAAFGTHSKTVSNIKVKQKFNFWNKILTKLQFLIKLAIRGSANNCQEVGHRFTDLHPIVLLHRIKRPILCWNLRTEQQTTVKVSQSLSIVNALYGNHWKSAWTNPAQATTPSIPRLDTIVLLSSKDALYLTTLCGSLSSTKIVRHMHFLKTSRASSRILSAMHITIFLICLRPGEWDLLEGLVNKYSSSANCLSCKTSNLQHHFFQTLSIKTTKAELFVRTILKLK